MASTWPGNAHSAELNAQTPSKSCLGEADGLGTTNTRGSSDSAAPEAGSSQVFFDELEVAVTEFNPLSVEIEGAVETEQPILVDALGAREPLDKCGIQSEHVLRSLSRLPWQERSP